MHNLVEGKDGQITLPSERALCQTTPLLLGIIYHTCNTPVYVPHAQSGGGEGRIDHPALKVSPSHTTPLLSGIIYHIRYTSIYTPSLCTYNLSHT